MVKARAFFSRSYFTILAVAVLCCAGIAHAGTPSKASVDSTLRKKLGNGLQVVIVPDHFAPVVRTQMIYHVGSAMAPSAFPGTAHALEHMMFNGSNQVSRMQLSAISALVGNRNNASTTEDITQYYFEAPAQNLDLLLRIEADRMHGLLLTEPDWQRERGAIEQEVSRDLSMPIERYLVAQNAYLFKDTPYAHDALGTRASFDATDTKRLRAFYQDWYQPNNATLLIVGDVDPNAALRDAEQRFGTIPARPLPPRPKIAAPEVKARTIKLPSDYPYGILAISLPAPGMQSDSYATTQVLVDALNSEQGELAALRASGEALYAAANYAPRQQAGALVIFAAFPKGADAENLLKKLQHILLTIRQDGIPDTLIAATKRKALTQLALSSNSLSGLSESWAEALSIRGTASPQSLVDAISKVTHSDVKHLSQQVLDLDHSLTGIILPSDHGTEPALQARVEEHFLPSTQKDVPLPDWATQSLTRLSLPAPLTQPVVTHLDNGLTLIVKPEPKSQSVQLFGVIRHSDILQDPAGKEGVTDLTDRLFLFGSQKYDRIRFAEAMDQLGADADTGLDFSVSALTGQFDKAFQIMAEVERHPAFAVKNFENFKKLSISALPGIMKSPQYRLGRAITAKLNPANDSSLREATPQTVRRINRSDIVTAYKKVFRPDQTIIVMIGDITPQHARKLIEAGFSDWKNPSETAEIDLPPRPLNKAGSAYIPDPGRTQSDVTLAETLPQGIDNPDRYALDFGSQVLSSGFNARLLQSLRVRSGLVYSVQSDLSWSRHRGAFIINYGADPDKATKARALAEHEISELCLKPVSEEELHTTKASMLRAMPLHRASFEALASAYLSLTSLGLPLTEMDKKAQSVFSMTPRQVQSAFCHNVDPARFVEAVLGPEESAHPGQPEKK